MSALVELWLVRHGESVGNVDGTDADTELSPRGCEQARHLAKMLESVEFNAVWTSPLRRARQTAALALPGASPIVDERLTEFRSGPPVQFIDTSSFDFDKLYVSTPASSYGPIETGKEFMARVKTWLSELSAGRIVVFTHFGVVREILAAFVPFSDVPQQIPHASVYRIDVGAPVPRAALWWAPHA